MRGMIRKFAVFWRHVVCRMVVMVGALPLVAAAPAGWQARVTIRNAGFPAACRSSPL